MKQFFFISCLFLSSLCIAQAPAIQWQTCLGGSAKDSATCVKQCSDGGYIVAGNTSSINGDVSLNHGGTDIWVVKLDVNGIKSWEKSFGGTGSDKAYCVQECRQGGYIVVGWTSSSDGDITINKGGYDYWVIKLDDTGAISWQKTYGGSGLERAYSLVQTFDNGYIIGGRTSSPDGDVSGLHQNGWDPDYWVVKINDTGAIVWQKCYGGSASDEVYCIAQTKDSGYIISGYTFSNDGDVENLHGGTDCWVVKINDTGKISWAKTYGGEGEENPYSIIQTMEGGYIFAGNTESLYGDVISLHGLPGLSQDSWVVKLNDTGKISWAKCYGGDLNDVALCIIQTKDNSYTIASGLVSVDGDVIGMHKDSQGNGSGDFWILNVNDTGGINWNHCYGGSNGEFPMCIMVTTDEGYIVAGPGSSNDSDVSGNHGNLDCWVVKLGPAYVSVHNEEITANSVSIYPNPVADVLHIVASEDVHVSVLSIDGKVLLRDYSLPRNDANGVDLSKLASGVYFVQLLSASGERVVVKIVKE